MEFIKKNFVILLAFILPIALIAVIALNAYLPLSFISTNYNFVYVSCFGQSNYYDCDNYLEKRYLVVDNKIVANKTDSTLASDNRKTTDINENYTARIFLHDTAKNESREITFEEAQALTLNSLITSPDGITVSGHYDENNGDFFFIFGGSSSSYGYYLTKGKSRAKLNLVSNTNRSYYRNNFQFIGWVLPGRN